jgi:hypothetical protein
VLANNEQTQGVWNSRLSTVMVAFRAPGSLVTPLGRIEVDHSCLLLVRKTGQGLKVSAANPENLPLALGVEIGAAKATINLPGGNFAGSTVTTNLRAAVATATAAAD